MRRGEIWWADLGHPTGSGAAKRRPVDAPGNVRIPKRTSGLGRDSVVNVSQVVTLDRSILTDRVSALRPDVIERIDDGLRLGLGL
jgi:mRNA interferase MazF